MQRNRGWIWFFVVLGVLATAAVAINWMYNSRQQLTPEKLKAAMDLWAKNGPADYDLVLEKAISSAASDGTAIRDQIEVKVRDKKVVAAMLNGTPLERRLWDDYDMAGWLDFVERFLLIDTKTGAPRTFRVAVFDPETGALRRFTRRVSGTRERQEIRLLLTPIPSGTATPELRGG